MYAFHTQQSRDKNSLTTIIMAVCFFVAFISCIFCLASCKSPEQIKKERLSTLQKFVGQVVEHILDRNPSTIRESIAHLQREELPTAVFEKLQNEGLLPMTELGVLKLIGEAEDHHTTNVIKIKSVKALGPIEKDIVPFQATGDEVDKTEGKPDKIKPFSCKVTCKLNNETGDWPQVVDVSGLSPATKTAMRSGHGVSGRKRHR